MAPLEAAPPLDESTVEVNAYSDPNDVESGPAVPEATALDIDPDALNRTQAPEAPSFESWEAPPGALDPAVARAQQPSRLSDPRPTPIRLEHR